MIFQDPYASLNPRWRVARLIAEPLHALGITDDPAETEARVADMLRRVRMSPETPANTRTSSPAASASALPSHAPSSASPISSSATNPPRPSMFPSRRRCSTSCVTCRMNSA